MPSDPGVGEGYEGNSVSFQLPYAWSSNRRTYNNTNITTVESNRIHKCR